MTNSYTTSLYIKQLKALEDSLVSLKSSIKSDKAINFSKEIIARATAIRNTLIMHQNYLGKDFNLEIDEYLGIEIGYSGFH